MNSFNPAQIADLVGIYISNTLDSFLDSSNIGLYRDYGLISIPSNNGLLTSR